MKTVPTVPKLSKLPSRACYELVGIIHGTQLRLLGRNCIKTNFWALVECKGQGLSVEDISHVITRVKWDNRDTSLEELFFSDAIVEVGRYVCRRCDNMTGSRRVLLGLPKFSLEIHRRAPSADSRSNNAEVHPPPYHPLDRIHLPQYRVRHRTTNTRNSRWYIYSPHHA